MANEMLVAALAYAKRGWPIFPCRADKTPYSIYGVNDATTDPSIITTWWTERPLANIGLNVGEAGMMVLDYDPGFNLEELEKNVGPIPSSDLLARTPRGGEHVYLTLHDGEIVAASASKLAPHCDVRSFHSYVLLPPSWTKDGTYTWERDGKPAIRTDEILRLANAAKERHKDHDTWLIEADLPENIASAVEWLSSSAKVAVDGQGGDQCAYNTAAMLKSFGISQALASDLMWEHWNPRCIPPWGADEADHFEQKIENGYAYNTSPPGNITAAYRTVKSQALFAAVERVELSEGHEWRSGRFRVLNRLGMESIEPPSWLVDKFIPREGYAMLYGPSGTYKTFVALDIALTVACGFALRPNWGIAGGGATAFVLGEGRANFIKRVRAWEAIHWKGERVPNFFLVDPVPNITEDPEAFMAGLAQASETFELVVLDTVGRAMQGANENSQEHASAFTALVEHIQRGAGAAVLALHHTGKDDRKGARGSSVFGADADMMVHMVATAHPRVIEMVMTKQKDAEPWATPQAMVMKDEGQSLVALKTDKPVIREPGSDSEAFMLDTIETAALEFLATVPNKAYSMAALAVGVATDNRVLIGEEQVRKKYLKALRSDSKRALSKCWLRHTERWKFQVSKSE